MKTLKRLLFWWLIFVFVTGFAAVPGKDVQAAGNRQAAGTISLMTMGTPYSQDFNTLATMGTMNNLRDGVNGWYLNESGGSSRDNELYAANTGSDNVADTYSYGATDSAERALGGLRSTNLVTTFGASFTNNTGSAITSLRIAYTGEEWRLGTAGRSDQLIFEYSADATSLTDGTWIHIPALDFTTPDTVTTGAKDGNAASERRALSVTISALNLPNGRTFWIRWSDADVSGYEDGLAVDDFSLTPQIDLSINDIALRERDGGATPFTFSISLSASAPPGGVTFDIAAADNTARRADGDYVESHLTGQTIPAGSSTYTFEVLVNGDSIAETDETFFVDVTNVSGAAVRDGRGLGMIINDDTATTIATSGSPSSHGAAVTFTATVSEPGAGTPTGTVEFFDGVTRLGAETLIGGQAAFSTTLLAVGVHAVTATYDGDADFNGSTSPDLTQVIESPPTVALINSAAPTSGGQIDENEHTRAAITQLLAVFSKDMDAADAQAPANYSLRRDGSTAISIDSIVYDVPSHTTMLNLNGGAPLTNGRYTLTVRGAIRDRLEAPIGADFVRAFFVDNEAPHPTRIVTIPDSSPIINGVTVKVRFSSLAITFNEDLNNPPGNTDPNDVTNPQNYLLVSPGLDGVFDKLSCIPGLAGGDVHIFTGPVTYDNHGGSGPFVATIQLNGGSALANGPYRLFICGTTSILDLAGNPLNNGLDEIANFNVLALDTVRRNPQTGFPPGMVTVLPKQPADKAYTDLGNLWIEIPKLNLKTGITGVPLTADGWDVTWLNRQVGWLEGTAYPTWEGNTVLTAHGYTADGEVGPFALLKNLSYGETIIIHLGGMRYTYVVRTNLLISPNDTRWLTKHETLDWVTLITCQQYDAKTKSYRYRRVVRAVLIRVEPE